MLRELLDYDQLQEVRLALSSRISELEKHKKKGSDLGIDESDAARRLSIIEGTTMRWGLMKLFAPVSAFSDHPDMFYDGGPAPRPTDDKPVEDGAEEPTDTESEDPDAEATEEEAEEPEDEAEEESPDTAATDDLDIF